MYSSLWSIWTNFYLVLTFLFSSIILFLKILPIKDNIVRRFLMLFWQYYMLENNDFRLKVVEQNFFQHFFSLKQTKCNQTRGGGRRQNKKHTFLLNHVRNHSDKQCKDWTKAIGGQKKTPVSADPEQSQQEWELSSQH